MAVDAVLWLILAAMIAWIACGCVLTARAKKLTAEEPIYVRDAGFDRGIARAT